MSWKRAMQAGAKPSKASRHDRRVTNAPSKCAKPGCNNNAKQEVNGYMVCGKTPCHHWAMRDNE